MKTFNCMLTATAITLGMTLSAQAGNALMSPKAKEQAHSKRIVVGTASVQHQNSHERMSPRYAEFQQSIRQVPSTGMNVNLTSASRPMLSPKDPRFEAVWRANAEQTFQVAPLK